VQLTKKEQSLRSDTLILDQIENSLRYFVDLWNGKLNVIGANPNRDD
jgi:hypothetical protein